ncbi:MAG: WD40 repeat domain-containing protein [Pontibacterium sp.]
MHKAHSILAGLTLTLALSGCESGKAPTLWKEYAARGAYSASLSASGRYAALGSFNHGGSLWQVTQHARQFNWNHTANAFSLIAATAFSPDETYAATASQQDLVLWNIADGKPAGFWRSPAEILKMDLSPNGDFALLGLSNHTAVYFDAKNGGEKRVFRHDGRVRTVDLSDDARYALTGSDAYKARLWNVETGELLQELAFENVVDTVALSPDGQWAFSSGSLDKAVIWNTHNGNVKQTLSTQGDFFHKRVSYLSARFSKNSAQLLTGTAGGLVQLWDVRSGKTLKHWRIHRRAPYGPVQAGVYAVGFGSGQYYALGSNGIMNVLK